MTLGEAALFSQPIPVGWIAEGTLPIALPAAGGRSSSFLKGDLSSIIQCPSQLAILPFSLCFPLCDSITL